MTEQRRARKGAGQARHDDAPREVSDIGLPRKEDAADSSAEDEQDPVSIERAHGVTRRRAWCTLGHPLRWRSRQRQLRTRRGC
jgi:hypothetical protein